MSMSAAAAHYAGVFSLSSVVSTAWLRGGLLSCLRSVRDIDDNCNRMLFETYAMSGASDSSLLQQSSVELPRFVLMDVSPSGKHTVTMSLKDDKPTISMQSREGISYKIDASAVHGKVIGDSNLGGLSWSSDEEYVVYVAQEKEAEVRSSFEKPSSETRNRFDYREDWGEKYDGVARLSLCVLSVKSGKVAVVPGIDSSLLTVGQPVFRPSSPSSYSIAYTAWRTSPRRLGMIYCFQRPSSIYAADVTALLTAMDSAEIKTDIAVEHRLLTEGVYASRSPRFSPQGDTLVFLGSVDRVASHNSNFQLLKIDLTSPRSPPPVEVVVDKVAIPELPKDFPGLFCDQLPRSCFVGPRELVLTSMWGSAESVVLVSLETGKATRLDALLSVLGDDGRDETADACSVASCAALEASEGCVVFAASSPVRPQKIGIYRTGPKEVIRSGDAPSTAISGKALPVSNPRKLLSNLRWKVYNFCDERKVPFDSILVTPAPQQAFESSLPLVLVLHGGPHSASPTSFLAAYAFLSSLLNASILHVNYRGSTGFGLESINSLPGNIG